MVRRFSVLSANRLTDIDHRFATLRLSFKRRQSSAKPRHGPIDSMLFWHTQHEARLLEGLERAVPAPVLGLESQSSRSIPKCVVWGLYEFVQGDTGTRQGSHSRATIRVRLRSECRFAFAFEVYTVSPRGTGSKSQDDRFLEREPGWPSAPEYCCFKVISGSG